MTGSVVQINVSRGGVPKRPVEQARITRDGVDGDSHAHPQFHGGPKQAVLWITSEGTAELSALGFPLYAGALGENITTQGLDRRQIRLEQRWAIGDELIIEITKLRVPCKALNVYGTGIQASMYDALAKAGDPASPKWGLSGFYASVVYAGTVKPGDSVRLIEA